MVDREQEFKRALDRLRTLLPAALIVSQQPSGANAVFDTLVTIWLMVQQRVHGGLTLEEVVTEFLDYAEDIAPGNKRVRDGKLSSRTGGYSRARTRLRTDVIEWTADHIFNSLVAATPPSFANRRAFFFDGTSITLSPTAALKKAYPPAVNQHGTSVWPVARLVVVHELESGCATLPELGPMYGENAVSETALARNIIPKLPANSVLIADRGFGIFSIVFTAVDHGHDVVLRMTKARFEPLMRRATLVGSTATSRCWKLDWTPSAYERKSNPELPEDASVSVWLHEIDTGNNWTLLLVSTVESPSQPLADLYRRRVDIETDIRDVKLTINLENLSVKTETMLKKEIAASMIAYNLVIQIRRLAARAINVPPRRLSFKGTWSAVRIILLSPRNWTAEQWAKKFELVLRISGERKIPDRPGRSYPRKAHKKCPKSMSGKKAKPSNKPK
jgi:hypothetical protein